MISIMVVIILLMILNVVVSYNIMNIRSSRIIIKKSIINTKLNAIPNTEDDSSELDFESSSSIKEKKQRLRLMEIEQENNIKALQKASRELLVKIEKSNEISKPSQSIIDIPKSTATSPIPVSIPVVASTPSSPSSSIEGMSSSENKAFDAGLLIAFPVIVATLGFFFFFPFLRENLASSLPPLPSVEEMMSNN